MRFELNRSTPSRLFGMNAGASAETERVFTFTTTAPKVVRDCLDDESLDSIDWCALVPPLFWVPRIRVAVIISTQHSRLAFPPLERTKVNVHVFTTVTIGLYKHI